MEADILEEMESLNPEDSNVNELNNIFNKMWNYSSKEFLVIYHPEGLILFKTNTFLNLLKFLGTSPQTTNNYMEPVIIFACIGSYNGALGYDRQYPVEFKPHTSLIVDKILLNKYQDLFIENKQLKTRLRIPTNIMPIYSDLFRVEPFNDHTVKRHPQLRRILKEYFLLIDQKLDEKILYEKLRELKISSQEYSYLDYDEIFLFDKDLCDGTYFEYVPIELKKIIVGIIDSEKYLSSDLIFAKNEPIIKAVENIVDIISETENASILDIINKLYTGGYLIDVFREVGNNDNNMYKYITSGIGLNTITDIINNKINKK